MDYREKYIEYYGEIEKDFVVHHLDHNRENNDIRNLVAVPKGLHTKYHTWHSQLSKYSPKRMIECYEQFTEKLNKFNDVYHVIIIYANLRNLPEEQIAFFKSKLYANTK